MIDVAEGDKIPRKGGPAIRHSDLLLINKTELAPYVGADLEVMARDCEADARRAAVSVRRSALGKGEGRAAGVAAARGAFRVSRDGCRSARSPARDRRLRRFPASSTSNRTSRVELDRPSASASARRMRAAQHSSASSRFARRCISASRTTRKARWWSMSSIRPRGCSRATGSIAACAVETGARLLLTTPSASRAHRTPEGHAEIEQEFRSGERRVRSMSGRSCSSRKAGRATASGRVLARGTGR